jgi:hypothetical protein
VERADMGFEHPRLRASGLRITPTRAPEPPAGFF